MADLVLDTDALADFLAQFYGPTNRGQGRFEGDQWLSADAASVGLALLAERR